MIATSLFALGLVLLPFNDLPLLGNIFGELSSEGAFPPMFLLVVFFIFREKFSFYLPRVGGVIFLLLFLGIALLSGMVNSSQILQAQFFGRSGSSKFFLQMLVLLFGVGVAITSFNLMHLGIINLKKVRRWLTISFLIAGTYSLFEIFFLLGASWADILIKIISPLIHSEEGGLLMTERLCSVTGEPSYFGMYGALVLPWLLSYLFTERMRWPFVLLTLYLIALMLLSLSRLAYAMLLLLALLLFYFCLRSRIISVRAAILSALLVGVTVAASFSFLGKIAGVDEEVLQSGVILTLTSKENLSNICRFGTQVAAVSMGLDYPLLGTGLGQFPFYMEKYLPTWAMVSPEIREYLHGEGLPRVHGMYARIFSELGGVGLALWLAFFLTILRTTYKTVRHSSAQRFDWLGLALVLNLVALAAFGFSIATFRKLEMWVIFGLAWAYCIAGPHSGKSRQVS